MAPEPQRDNPLDGLPVVSPETLGRHSRLELLALRLRERGFRPEQLQEALALSDAELLALYYDFENSLRPVQQAPPMAWQTDLTLGGRGAGKTHKGAGGVLREAANDPEARILIVGPTYTEIVKNQLEGPSGILTLAPPWNKPHHRRSKKQLVWPNGVVADYLPAQKADKFRGYGYTFEWLDEVAAWEKDPVEVFSECCRVARGTTARMRRLGLSPRKLITTTPKPTPVFRKVLEDREGLVITRTSTFDNAAHLDPAYLRMARRLAATVEGRREFLGELFFDMDPALYRRVDWNASRVKSFEAIPARPGKTLFDIVVVSVDPATGEKKGADLHGIVVEGIREEDDGLLHTYVLQDLSLQAPEPSAWAKAAVKAFHTWKGYAPERRAWVFAETNTGGSMVKNTVRQEDGSVKFRGRRAMQSKAERAAPVSALAEAKLVHMVGKHHRLEDQLSKFTGQEGGHGRDDRADAFAWPIYLYVAPKRQNRGAAGRAAGEEEEDEE